MSTGASWRRAVNRYAPFVLSIAGMVVVFSGIVLFLDHDVVKIGATTVGTLVFLAGFWYRFNPFLTSERRYGTLRHEVDEFIGLVRGLHRAAIGGDARKLAEAKSAMHGAVDRLVDVAAKTPGGGGITEPDA